MRPKAPIRMTPQRTAILEAVRQTRDHPTADEIYERVRRVLPRISLGTVYRNLEILAQEGMIQKIESGAGQKRYDGNPSAHPHLRCLRCGRLEDAPLKRPLDAMEALAETKGYQVFGFLLEFVGICPACLGGDDSRGNGRRSN